MIHTIRKRLRELKKNGNLVNVLADSTGNTLILTAVTVKSVREGYVVFTDGTTDTSVELNKLLDIEF
ncbi:MAG TPA: hypothetical protein VNU93_03435 [Verrucomicrobiae bacterium]|nr:hypothetical protein [Verrucomicrobiae bacterium]